MTAANNVQPYELAHLLPWASTFRAFTKLPKAPRPVAAPVVSPACLADVVALIVAGGQVAAA